MISAIVPQRGIKKYSLGFPILTINYFIKETEEGYEYNTQTLPLGKVSYGDIVNAIITKEYPNDRMQAVVNNYLASPDDAEIVQEFNEMQAFRARAKQEAKDILAELEQ